MHNYTYPELTLLSEEVTSSEGHTFKPIDLRKGYVFAWSEKDEQHQPISLWVAWQRSVQRASKKSGVVPSRVMDYFQNTKHLTKPPAEGDKTLLGEPLEAVKSAAPTKPLFATSYSGMQLFELCPLKWAAEKWYKTVPYEEGEAAKWGNRVHLAKEHILLEKPTAEDVKLITDQGWMKYPQAMLKARDAGSTLLVEKELCLTESLTPCGWKDWNTVWFRLKADVLLLKDAVAKYFDWKTGKFKDDPFQIETTWAVLSKHHPEMEEFDGKLIFLKENKIWGLEKPLTRADLPRIWDKIFAITDRMKEAVKHENFRMVKNGLCNQYCGNTACPHCGRGR